MARRFAAILIAVLLPTLMAGCEKHRKEILAYQAACEGHPLLTMDKRYQAIEAGYLINREHDCIDKASFVAVRDERARRDAANTPAAIAAREAEFARENERYAEQRRVERAAREAAEARAMAPSIVLHDVDVNAASAEDIARTTGLGAAVAAQIIEERSKRPFTGWTDLSQRVVGLSAAQPAAYASICGLTVNGNSLEGAPPNAAMAALILKKYQQSSTN